MKEIGVICPCGVTVEAYALKEGVIMNGGNSCVYGDLKYIANVCITRLENSTLSLRFEDTDGHHSFLFAANKIISVTCYKKGGNCEVIVSGTGMIGMKDYPFTAVFEDRDANDRVQNFEISDFFKQIGTVPVRQGSIVALGCQCL